MRVGSLSQEDPLEKEKATHSSILAQRIPWTEEPGTVHEATKSQTRLHFHFKAYLIIILDELYCWCFTDYSDLVALSNKHLLSHQFCESEICLWVT